MVVVRGGGGGGGTSHLVKILLIHVRMCHNELRTYVRMYVYTVLYYEGSSCMYCSAYNPVCTYVLTLKGMHTKSVLLIRGTHMPDLCHYMYVLYCTVYAGRTCSLTCIRICPTVQGVQVCPRCVVPGGMVQLAHSREPPTTI